MRSNILNASNKISFVLLSIVLSIAAEPIQYEYVLHRDKKTI